MKKKALYLLKIILLLLAGMHIYGISTKAQSWELTPGNIDHAIRDSAVNINKDPMRPAFHLTPPAGRDPFVFKVQDRTFLIACADLFEENYVPVPIFEAKNDALTEWDYKGNLFTVPKHQYRNLEVPEFRPLGDKWLFM